MSCRAVYYKYLVAYLRWGFDKLSAKVGDDALVLVILSISSIVLVVLFHRVQAVITPKAVEWYKTRLLAEAQDWFDRSNLRFIGFKFRTTIISVGCGAAFYLATKSAIGFPEFYMYSLPLLILMFIGIAFVGYYSGGNVSEANRNKYFKRFYVPTLTGVTLLAVNLVLDVLLNLTVAILDILHLA